MEEEGYLDFIQFDASRRRKTMRFRVKHRDTDDELGVVKWHSRWRRYCFFPEADTLFDEFCLAEIQLFIMDLMEERRLM